MKLEALVALGAILIAPSLAGAGGLNSIGAAFTVCGSQNAADSAVKITTVGSLLPDDPIGIGDCEDLCLKWIGLCKGAVGGVQACWKRAMNLYAGVSNAECKTDAATAKTCKAAVKADVDEGKARLKEDVAEGRTFCENEGFGICLLECAF
jgi:hypothetical protein